MARDLEVWAVSDDGEFVLLAASPDARRATHQLRIDARLEAAVRRELDDDDEERRESELSPKEIQARLRAGDTVEEVAKAARVAVGRVSRYAGPVISERERIVDQARASVVQRPRGPQGETPLGRVVDKRLAETGGLRSETVVWSARRRNDGAWVVALSYTARGGARTAEWLWQPGSRELTSLNALGTRLGADDVPVTRRRRAPAATGAATRATRTARTAGPKRSPAKKATAAKPAARKAPARRTSAPQPAAQRSAARATARRTGGAPTSRVGPAKPTAPRSSRAAAAKATTPRTAKRAATRPSRPAPKPTPVVEPTTKRTNGRVAIPSWDDVLLGVRSPAAARGRRRS